MYSVRALGKVPIFLDKIQKLEPIVRLLLTYVIAYFICVSLVYITMPFVYTLLTLIIGYIIFVIPQVYLHNGIKLKKHEILQQLEGEYWLLLTDLLGVIRTKNVDPGKIDKLSSISIIINNVRNSREWVIDYSSALKLLGSSSIIMLIKYVFTGIA